MEVDSVVEDDLEREKLIRSCLQLASELEQLDGELREKREKNKQLEEELAEAGERPERDGHQQQVVGISDCRVDVFEVGSGQEERPDTLQRNEPENQSQDRSSLQCQHPGCGRRYKNKESLRKHRYIHKTKYQCQECQKCFENSSRLQDHLPIHTGERPFVVKNFYKTMYKCQHPGCGRRYKSKNGLYQHRYHRHNIHKAKYQCQVCQKCFRCASYLQIHLRKHTEERPFACGFEGCGQRFKHNFTLKNHIQHVHSGDCPFQCPHEGCSKRFKLETHVKKHFKQVHFDDRQFQCFYEGCLESFKTKALLKAHFKEAHSVVRPFDCHYEGCLKTFKRKPNLQDHLKTHSDARSFSCQFPGCSKSFKTNANLIAHKNYNGHKYLPFRCHHKDCLKMIETNTERQKHLQMHSSTRPFKCQFPACLMTFKRKTHLNEHMKNVHSDSKQFL